MPNNNEAGWTVDPTNYPTGDSGYLKISKGIGRSGPTSTDALSGGLNRYVMSFPFVREIVRCKLLTSSYRAWLKG